MTDYLIAAAELYSQHANWINPLGSSLIGAAAFIKASPGTQNFLLWLFHYPIRTATFFWWLVSFGWMKGGPVGDEVVVIVEGLKNAKIRKVGDKPYLGYDNTLCYFHEVWVKDEGDTDHKVPMTWAEQSAVKNAYKERAEVLRLEGEANLRMSAATGTKAAGGKRVPPQGKPEVLVDETRLGGKPRILHG